MIQNLFSNFMSTDAVRTKSLHAEVVYETILFNIFNIFPYIFISNIPVNKSQGHRKSISFQHTQSNSRPNAFEWANLDVAVPIFLFLRSNKHFCTSPVDSNFLSCDASLILIPTNAKLLYLLFSSFRYIMDGLHALDVSFFHSRCKIIWKLGSIVVATSPTVDIVFLFFVFAHACGEKYSNWFFISIY